jgi:hypothetical protein
VGPVFCFSGAPFGEFHHARVLIVAGRSCNRLCLLAALDLAPIVCRGIAASAVSERQEEQIWLAVLGIPSSAAFCHPDKAKSFSLTNGRRNEARRNPIFHEIELGHRQAAVIVTAMVRELDCYPINDLAR